jgi:hypothetical protein
VRIAAARPTREPSLCAVDSRSPRRRTSGNPVAPASRAARRYLPATCRLEEFDDDEFMPVHPAGDEHQQNVSSGGTEPTPEVYRGPLSNCWTLPV